jgi:aspartate carbamoyltransferase catalytic subunit
MTIKMEKSDGRRKKKQTPPAEEKKPDSIHYNCTVRVPKRDVLLMFRDKAERMQKVAEILAQGVLRAYREEQQKAAQKSAPAPMSVQGESDKSISKSYPK